MIERILNRVACACGELLGTFDYRGGWLAPALETGVVGEDQSHLLYNEADSAGYIEKDAQDRWRWRHPMCAEYLTSIPIP